MTERELVRQLAREINTAYLPATRHTTSDFLKNRGCGRTDEGQRRLSMHYETLRDAIGKSPEIGRIRVKALHDGLVAEFHALQVLTDVITGGKL